MRGTLLLLLLLPCLCSCSTVCRTALLKNTDFPGSDIRQVFAPDVELCQQICTQNPSCKFFTFIRADWTQDTRNFYCYLKSSTSGNPSSQTTLQGVTSGYSLKPCLKHKVPCFDGTYDNVNFPGSNYKSMVEDDAEKCQFACTIDPICKFYSWANNLISDVALRKQCFMKTVVTVPSPPKVVKLKHVISGFPKRCS